MAAKPLKYPEKIVVMLSLEQATELKRIADETGDSASGILRRLVIKYISEYKKKTE